LWEQISQYTDDTIKREEKLDLPLSGLIALVQKNLNGKEIVINDEEQLKMFRR
jgi:hypothetical protein